MERITRSTVPAGTWKIDPADGTVYPTPITGTTPPGVHDQTNVNPDFTDPTRNLQSWDAWLGGPGTVAGALALLQQNPALTDSSLLPYIQTGFAPTNPAYHGTGLGGTDIGAVPANVQNTMLTSQSLTPSTDTVRIASQSLSVLPGRNERRDGIARFRLSAVDTSLHRLRSACANATLGQSLGSQNQPSLFPDPASHPWGEAQDCAFRNDRDPKVPIESVSRHAGEDGNL